MTTQTKEVHKGTESQKAAEETKQVAEKDAKSVKDFVVKFNHDWVMNFAAGLAFNLITAIFPVAIAILIAIFGGSRLFVSIEGYFAIIYHTRQRNIIPQNLMALGMLLLFVVLVPLMVFASSLPALVQSILKATPFNNFPGSGFVFPVLGILVGLLIAWILFEAIYIIVPNQHISFRNSWRGAVVAAIALQIYLVVFPFYVTHFLGNDSGQIGFAVILLFFFYYFAVILLLGAEINAFYAEGVQVTPDSVAAMVHQLTSHLQTNEKDQQDQAPPSHKHKEPKDIRPQSEAKGMAAHEAQPSNSSQSAALPEHEHLQSDSVPEDEHIEQASSNHLKHDEKNKRRSSSPGTSTALILVEALAGTALAFVLQFFKLRSKK